VLFNKKGQKMLYAAYGSNLNHDQMARRCPKAKFVGVGVLDKYRLVFRGVADIEHSKKGYVPVGLWEITGDCLMRLDAYEGYPNMYGRETVDIRMDDKEVDAIIYYMNSNGYASPTQSYFNAIKDGYEHCGIKLSKLYDALEHTKQHYFLDLATRNQSY
jgi:gamma-glutamylcyclotransferase (GGCT)/AIG2-like uncharacterized protein YtfP